MHLVSNFMKDIEGMENSEYNISPDTDYAVRPNYPQPHNLRIPRSGNPALDAHLMNYHHVRLKYIAKHKKSKHSKRLPR